MSFLARFRKKTANLQFNYDGVSIRNGRPTNMDCLGIQERIIDGRHALLAVVCDGVGSLEDGGFAASEVIKGMVQWFSELESLERIQVRMRDKAMFLNQYILDASARLRIETATTFSALLIVDQKYYLAHAGDSRIYRYRAGRLEQLTQDDVSDSGALTNCIGHFDDPLIYCSQGDVRDDVLLLCSDGMYKRMDYDFLISQLEMRQDIRTTLEHLAEYVIQMGEQDNISIIIVKTGNGGQNR